MTFKRTIHFFSAPKARSDDPAGSSFRKRDEHNYSGGGFAPWHGAAATGAEAGQIRSLPEGLEHQWKL